MSKSTANPLLSKANVTPSLVTYLHLIENKLHWQKDVTWQEDRLRARTGNTPSILSYLRSLALQFIRQKHVSVTQAIEQFTEQPQAYLNLLTQLQIV